MPMPAAAREAIYVSRDAMTRVYGIPQTTVCYWIYERRSPIPFYRLNRRVAVFKRSEVEAWLESRRVAPGAVR